MLGRTATRTLYRDARRLCEQWSQELSLPWLCPAQLPHRPQRRHIATSSPSPKDRRPKVKAALESDHPLSRRPLATATAEHVLPYEEYVPFEGPAAHDAAATQQWPPPRNTPDLSTLKNFDPTMPLVINSTLATAPRRLRAPDYSSQSIAELHLTLEACLKVGRLERAAALVRRCGMVYTSTAPALLVAHNAYLRALTEQTVRSRTETDLKALQKWYEVEMRRKHVAGNATTYALLVKASLNTLEGKQLDRTVRRYMDIARETHMAEELLNLPILTDAELNHVWKLYEARPDNADDTTSDPNEPTEDQASSVPAFIPVPEVRPVAQKGLGLETLRKTIAIFSDPTVGSETGLRQPGSDLPKFASREEEEAYQEKRQLSLESGSVTSAAERWRAENEQRQRVGLNTALQSQDLASLLWEWQTALTKNLKDFLQEVDAAEVKPKKNSADLEICTYGPFMRLVPPERLAAITILSSIAGLSSTGLQQGSRLSNILMYVGKAVEEEAEAIEIQAALRERKWRGLTNANRERAVARILKTWKGFRGLQEVTRPDRKRDSFAYGKPAERLWSAPIRAKVGARLVAALMDVAKVPMTREHPETGEPVTQMFPAFLHTFLHKVGKRVGFLSAHEGLVGKLTKVPPPIGLVKHLPMVMKPKKWTSFVDGGFLQYHVNVVRANGTNTVMRQYVEAAVDKGDMDQIFAGLDVLSKTPWRINRGVFDVMIRAWDSGEKIGNLAPETPKLDLPTDPGLDAEPREVRKWAAAVKTVEHQRSGLHSQRCFQNFQMEIARAYVNETFYYPHNLDFRGRAYPIPPYLNHMGADNCRGLLMFAKGRELGSHGLRWLKVHLANVYGFDKASFQEREDFTMEHLNDIYDSAVNPLDGGRWWLTAEDAWQCLAACQELKAALDSPEPTRYISHLPLHQDGTCNGLQHYAALGGDSWGAKQVNLEPGSRPADVYTAVAELVKREIADDVAAGVEEAIQLQGKITRKVVKQTVMTNVYGVTFIGARDQIRRQLEDIMGVTLEKNRMYFGKLAMYVARKIFRALSSMFRGAHEIQHWFAECADRISKTVTIEQVEQLRQARDMKSPPQKHVRYQSTTKVEYCRFMSPVIWTSPLKMPVVQPYREQSSRGIPTNLQRVTILEPRAFDPISKRKQLQAFAPNFVHSLDATHMLLSALKCDQEGMTFAAVHDSFWTHAADIDKMNDILRDTFVQIHSEDVIGRLAAEFDARYKGAFYLASIPSKCRVANKLRQWRKSLKEKKRPGDPIRAEELLLEHTRQRLLKSENPKDREKGKRMVTPSTIFAQYSSGEGDVVSAADTTGVKVAELGNVPGGLEGKQREDVEGLKDAESHGVEMGLNGLLDDEESTKVDDEAAEEHHDEGSMQTAAEGSADHDDATDECEEEISPAKTKKPTTSKTKTKITASKSPKEKRPAAQGVTKLWLPLTFPAVPRKGDFDVSRLKKSQYFFS
ncbi:MAG: DNA-directed RNA polymerase [Caeruleum heppii]|nr:MAG: DNA-directed RNA polymerase [Caeruleum heppii]